MVHLSNLLSVTVLFYAAVTRAALTVAWALGRITRRAYGFSPERPAGLTAW